MQKKLLFKILAVIAVMLLIGIPLLMIESTIRERSAYRQDAARSIAEDSVGEQTVYGPVLVMPYSETYEVMEPVAGDEKRKEAKRYRKQLRHLVFPDQLEVKSTFGTERRYRGIHQVLMFQGEHAVTGAFTVPPVSALPRTVERSDIAPEPPFVSLGISDVRGVRDIPKVRWGARSFEFEQGSGLAAARQGLHVPLAMADATAGLVQFSFGLSLSGMDRQQFVPLARNNRFAMASSWPHPQFSGRFLPEQRKVGEQGFEALWRISALSTEAQQQLRQRELAAGSGDEATRSAARSAVPDSFAVGFIEPVNIYSMADRATKYGLLFVALTFAAFFLFEVLKRLPIHPVQYALVGLALVLFFLLLVSLSEHIAFLGAYLLASAACILLTGYYLAHVLRDRRRGLAFGAALTALYGVLYGLLSSENNALVMGAILLFAVLAAIMVATRKVDWYQLGGAEAAQILTDRQKTI
jgi:inner membrane protein